jgi:hypothetical protein
MLTYILEVIFFISAGIVLYLFISKLPVLEGMGEETKGKRSFLRENMARLADEKLVAGSLKLLRRLRLLILKLDNFVVRRLEKVKAKAEEQQKEEKDHILTAVGEKQEEEK